MIRDVDLSYQGTPLLHAAFHAVADEERYILADSGRDWLTASRVIDIAALCAAPT